MRPEIHSLATHICLPPLLLLLAKWDASMPPGAEAQLTLPASFSRKDVDEVPIKVLKPIQNSCLGGKHHIFLGTATNHSRLQLQLLSGAPSQTTPIAQPHSSCLISPFGLEIIYVLQYWMQGCKNLDLKDHVNSRLLNYIIPLFHTHLRSAVAADLQTETSSHHS